MVYFFCLHSQSQIEKANENALIGWVAQWMELDTLNNIAMEGLEGYQDMATESLSITSRSGTKSALWTGRNINTVVRTVTFFDDNDLYVRSFVTVKNDGPNIITDFYCKTLRHCLPYNLNS